MSAISKNDTVTEIDLLFILLHSHFFYIYYKVLWRTLKAGVSMKDVAIERKLYDLRKE
jgi:hypothetical protein